MIGQLPLTRHRADPSPAAALRAELRSRCVEVWAADGRVRHHAPTGAMSMALLMAMKAGEDALLALLEDEAAATRDGVEDHGA